MADGAASPWATNLATLVIEPVLPFGSWINGPHSLRRYKMNVSKILAAAIAATSIVGGVGLAYAQTTSDTPPTPAYPQASASTDAAQTPPSVPADTKTTVIAPAETQKAAAQDPSMQAATEGTQGTQSGPAPSTAKNGSATTAPAPMTNDSTVPSELRAKADRN